MKLSIRYIEDALRDWNARGQPDSTIPATSLDGAWLQKGVLIVLDTFPDRWLIVVCREIDPARQVLTLFVDLLPSHRSSVELPENVLPFPGRDA